MSALAKTIERSRREREDWRYTDIEKLMQAVKTPVPRPVPELPANTDGRQRIIFVNGVLDEDLSTLGDPTALPVQGGAEQGYRLKLAAKSCHVTSPVELMFVGEGAAEISLNLIIEIGSNASLTIIEHHLASGSAAQVIESEIHLGAQAKLVHEKIMHDIGDAPHFARTSVHVQDGAYYRNFALIKNSKLMRNELDVTLAGPLAQCGLYGALLLRGREHADILTRVHHAAPHGTSRQLYKAVVKDQARGVFQGRIAVAKDAQKTDGQQLCRALLLSDQAEMDAKPELEIFADDVACSHGCAIGDLDRDVMFYLRSRGLSENEARALLLRAFVDEVIDTIQAPGDRAYAHDLAEGWMNE